MKGENNMRGMTPKDEQMNILDDTATVYVEGSTNIFDVIMQKTGRTCFFQKTVREVRAEHPGRNVQVLPFSEVKMQIESARNTKYCTPAIEITEERFHEMLNVLPPENWHRENGWEVFRMVEYTCGNITDHFVRFGDHYFTTCRAIGAGVYQSIIEEIRAGKFQPLT